MSCLPDCKGKVKDDTLLVKGFGRSTYKGLIILEPFFF